MQARTSARGPVAIDAPFADTSAADLVWSLDRPLLPALASVTAVLGGHRVELRVLGASHQVLVDGPTTAGPPVLLETVACLNGSHGDEPMEPTRRSENADPCTEVGEGTLPNRVAQRLPGADYLFECVVERHSPESLRRRVAEVLDRVDTTPAAVAAAFPGDPAAVTALTSDASGPGRLRWTTWHAYPQSGELVCTRSSADLNGTPASPRSGSQEELKP